MSARIRFLVFLLTAVIWISCESNYGELGNRTFFYYLNGTPQYPNCMVMDEPYIHFADSGRAVIHFCNKRPSLAFDYVIKNFHGPGYYPYRPGANGTDFRLKIYGRDFNSVEEGTYIRILEWDVSRSFLSAVFEAHVRDANGSECHITKGRFNGYIWINENPGGFTIW